MVSINVLHGRMFSYGLLALGLQFVVTSSSYAIECDPRAWATLSARNQALARRLADLEEVVRTRFPIFQRITDADNGQFLRLARRARLDPERPRLFIDVELAILKELNDVVFAEGKGFVTALSNAFKEMFYQELQRSQLASSALVVRYSDHKSLRFGFSEDNSQLRTELAKIYERTTQRYNAYLSSFGMDEYLSTQRGIASSPRSWFLSGIGTDPDEANIAARFARTHFRPQGTATLDFRSIREEIEQAAGRARNLTRQTEAHFAQRFPQLLDANGEVSAALVEILLKTRGNGRSRLRFMMAISDRIRERFGVLLQAQDVELLFAWKQAVDLFQPGIFVVGRDPIILNNAENGALFLDIAGQNVRNFRYTARALRDLPRNEAELALSAARAGELQATTDLNRRRSYLETLLREEFGDMRGRLFQSGDDAAFVPNRNLSRTERVRLYSQIRQSEFSGDFRLSFVAPRYSDTNQIVSPEHLEQLGAMAENFEKDFRKNLEPILRSLNQSYQDFRQRLLALEVEPRQGATSRMIIYVDPNIRINRDVLQQTAQRLAQDYGGLIIEIRDIP